ncbi:MAG: cupin domain-containing protein [Proteobacteria bacterium]|nr:MAG: cupin domain-containing protein [Pseudomonadota bacterium]
MKPVINLDEVELEPRAPFFQATGAAADRYDARVGQIASRLGLTKLGCNVTSVPPGKRGYPAHNHYANDELFVVLEGVGELRVGESRYPLRQGDVIACPAGGAHTAHQILNTGDGELRYLAISTRLYPEIVEYPDSAKFGVMGSKPEGPDGKPGWFRFVGREGDATDYWDGE